MEINGSNPDNASTQQVEENTENKQEELALVPAIVNPSDAGSELKHPLQHRWTMWYDNPGKKTSLSSWGDHLRKIVTIDTVEDFWGLYNNIVPASKLAAGANYHLFKEGIEPKWEDPENQSGGKWIVPVPAKLKATSLDKIWLWTLLACIGEIFEDEGEVNGCVVSARRNGDKIALWTKTGQDENAVKRIGRQFKASIECPDNSTIGYQIHSDCLKKSSSFNNKNCYEV